MRTIIITFFLALLVTVSLAIKVDAKHLKSNEHPTFEVFLEKVDDSLVAMKESRLLMTTELSENQQRNLILKHMQDMKNGMEMLEIEAEVNSAGHQYDRRIILMRSQVEIMMELMRGVMSQQEILMVNRNSVIKKTHVD